MDLLGGKTGETLVTLAGVGAGFLAWEAAATAKYGQFYGANNPNGSLFSSWRLTDALAGIIGNQAAKKINPNWTGGADLHPNPFGWANKITFSGIGAYIINQFLKQAIPKYKNFDAIPELVDSIAAGVAVGGAVGGVFDPNPSGFSVASSPESGGVASGNVPFGRGEGHNGHISVVG